MHINCFFLKSPKTTEEHPRLFNVGVPPLGAGARYETRKQDLKFSRQRVKLWRIFQAILNELKEKYCDKLRR